MRIEIVRELPGERWAELREECRAEGFRFLDRLVDEWVSGANRFSGPGEALFAARRGAAQVALCGLNVDPYLADPRVARLRHLYVRRSERGRGVGRRLVRHVLDFASGSFDRVRLRTDTQAAARFYEAQGFLRCDPATDATHERVP